MRKYSVRHNKGCVSLYFLGILLYICAISTVVVENDCHRMKTLMNLKEDAQCFAQEREVILRMKCVLSQKKEDIPLDAMSPYRMEVDQDRVYVDVDGDYPEMITIIFDTDTKKIIDYESIRYS